MIMIITHNVTGDISDCIVISCRLTYDHDHDE